LLLVAGVGGPVTLTVGGNNATTAYAGNLTDLSVGSSLIKVGSGTLTLSNASYTGDTVVSNVNAAGTLLIAGGSFGSVNSTIVVGTTNPTSATETLIISNATATANTVLLATNGNVGNAYASTMSILGSGSAAFNNFNMGGTNNTSGPFTINTTGTVGLGTFTDVRDINGGQSFGSGVIIRAGTVTASSMDMQGDNYTGQTRNANLNIFGGSVTITAASGGFKVGDNSGGGISNNIGYGAYLSMTNGTLTYLGSDGLLLGNGNSTNLAVAVISGGTAYLSGVTMNWQNFANTTTADSLTVSNGAALYLGGAGLVINQPSATVFASFGNGGATIGALTNWATAAPVTLAGTTTFQAGDTNNTGWTIELDGLLTGVGGLVKSGGGALILSDTNSYRGTTTVGGGTLVVTNLAGEAGSATGTNTVTVQTNGTVGGLGIMGGNVVVNNGGHTYPGVNLTNGVGQPAGEGTTVGGSLSYNSGGEADFNESAYATFNNNVDDDELFVSNNLVIGSGARVGINATDANTNLDTTADYVLISNVAGGTITGSFARNPVWLGGVPANAANYSVVNAGSYVTLHYSPLIISNAVATPNPAGHGQQVTFTVNTVSTGNSIAGVMLDASALGGSNVLTLVESNGTSLYTNSVVVAPGTGIGSQVLPLTVVDSGGNTNATVTIGVTIISLSDVWNGAGQPNNTWGDVTNWAGNLSPGNGDAVTFAGTVNLTPNLDSSYTNIAGLTFSNNAGSFNLTNGADTLTLTGGVTNNSGGAQTLSVPVALVGTQTFDAVSNNLVFSNTISGAGGMNVAGVGTNILVGSNSYSGPTTVNAGSTLQLANSNAVAGSALTLDSGSALLLRADTSSLFGTAGLAAQNTADTLNIDVNALTSGSGQTLSLTNTLSFTANTNQAINVTGNSTYTLSLGAVNLTSGDKNNGLHYLNVSVPSSAPALKLASVTSGNYGDYLNVAGGGNVTITGNLGNQSNGSLILHVNGGTTVTLQGASVKSGAGDGYKYQVADGTLVLDNSGALTNNTTGAGNNQSYFILGAATNNFEGAGYLAPVGVLVTNNNSYNCAVYLGDAGTNGGGLTVNALTTNYVSDGDIGFTNSGVFTIGGQNTSGTNSYNNPIILGWTANNGKSVTLVAATGGEVDFTGGLLANGTDRTAGITVGDAVHGGVVKIRGANNTYGGTTTVSNGTLYVSGTLGTNAVTVAGGTLLDNGTVPGVVNVLAGGTLGGGGAIPNYVTNQAGGVLFPGAGTNAAGVTLTVSGVDKVVLAAGSTNLFRVSANGHTSDQVNCSQIVYGGTLTVTTNLGDSPLPLNSSYTLFSAFYGSVGSFSATNLPALGPNLGWNTGSLGLNGSIQVAYTGPAAVAGVTNLTAATGPAPLAVTFSNLSTGATGYLWSFGDGNTLSTGAGTNVVHTYAGAGTYTNILTAYNVGGTNAATNLASIVVTPPVPVANFTGTPTGGAAPLVVTFANLSVNAASYVWNFGDGNTLVTGGGTNVTDTYTNAGSYTVILTATGSGLTNSLTNTAYIVVTGSSPVAGFSGTPTNGAAPLVVTFANLSSNATNYVWNFGDGNTLVTGGGTNVTDTYTNAGSYTVILSAIGLGTTNSLTNTAYIVVSNPPPVAGFSGTPTNLFVTQAVVFTNTSTGSYTNSAWSFGDGNAATNTTGANVTNTYAAAGSYTVQLIVSGTGGANTNTQGGYLVVRPRPGLGRPVVAGGTNFVFSGTNGVAGASYSVLSSTNVAQALANWTPLVTNTFNPDGSYSYTNTSPTNKARFFRLKSPP
jgi:autotransporter-associated beta strand protein